MVLVVYLFNYSTVTIVIGGQLGLGYYGSSGYLPLAVSEIYAGITTMNRRAETEKMLGWGSRHQTIGIIRCMLNQMRYNLM